MNASQKRRTSPSDFPFGSKSDPPFPPPNGRPVKAFLKICSNAKNLSIPSSTLGWNRNPPLYGPSALNGGGNCIPFPSREGMKQ